MKKSILALSVLSVLSFGASAEVQLPVQPTPIGEVGDVIVSPITDPIQIAPPTGVPISRDKIQDRSELRQDDRELNGGMGENGKHIVENYLHSEKALSRQAIRQDDRELNGGMSETGKHIVNKVATGGEAEARRTQRKADRDNSVVRPVEPIEDIVTPITPPTNDGQLKEAHSDLYSAGQATSAQMQAQAASINENAAKIDELFNVTADLREDLELQGARNMAAISARAFTTEEDQFSLGLGLGGSGSENAMAIGGAYQINAEWSVNSTVAFDTGSNVDYGVGVNYTW